MESLNLPLQSSSVPIAAGMSMQHQHQQQASLFYPGSGFLSSLAAYQTPGAEFGASGLSLLQGFNFQQMHHLQQQNLYLHQSHDLNIGTSSEPIEEKVLPHSNSHQEWSQSQGFNISSGGGGYYTTESTASNTDTSTVGVPLNPAHWTDNLASYGGPLQPPSSTAATATTSTSSPPSFL